MATSFASGASLFFTTHDESTVNPEVVFNISSASGIDEDEVLNMYCVLNFPELAGDGSTGAGLRSIWEAMLSSLDGRTTYGDSAAIQMLVNARQLAQNYADTALDVNGNFLTDADDALILYHGYRLSSILGDGSTGGIPAPRRTFLSGLATVPYPTDEVLRDLLERVNLLNRD